MAICIRCRRDPCRCLHGPLEIRLELEDLLDEIDTVARRNDALTLSAQYVRWIEDGEVAPEPLIPAAVRRRIREFLGR